MSNHSQPITALSESYDASDGTEDSPSMAISSTAAPYKAVSRSRSSTSYLPNITNTMSGPFSFEYFVAFAEIASPSFFAACPPSSYPSDPRRFARCSLVDT